MIQVNVARKYLFCHQGRSTDCLPPTQAALAEHIKRAAYQAGHVWAQMFSAIPNLPSPSEWEWLKEQMQVGKLHGQHFQRLRKPVLNYFDVDARKGEV